VNSRLSVWLQNRVPMSALAVAVIRPAPITVALHAFLFILSGQRHCTLVGTNLEGAQCASPHTRQALWESAPVSSQSVCWASCPRGAIKHELLKYSRNTVCR
jgi:hypothetical protein